LAKRSNTNAAYTTEFHHEFRAETGKLLVRRFLWFTAVVVAFGLLSMIGGMVVAMSSSVTVTDGSSDPAETLRNPLTWVFSAIWLVAFATALVYVWRKKPPEFLVLRISFWVVTFDGLLNIVSLAAGVPGSMGAFGFFMTHLLACLFMVVEILGESKKLVVLRLNIVPGRKIVGDVGHR